MIGHSPDVDRPGALITPASELVLPKTASHAEWLTARRAGIGGSDALAVIGLDPYKTRLEVYLDKVDRAPVRPQTKRMRWGQIVEDSIATYFSERTGIGVRHCGLLRNLERTWQLASVDRLTNDGGLLEVKNTSIWRAKEWSDDQIADGAEAQAQHYLDVTGLDHAWVAVQIGGDPPEIRLIERNESFIADIRAMEEEFWQLVVTRTPPALEGGAAAADLIKRMFPSGAEGKRVEVDEEFMTLLAEHRRHVTEQSAAEKNKKAVQSRLAQRMGTASVAVYRGEVVAEWKNERGREVCDGDVLREKFPDAAGLVLSRRSVRKFYNKMSRR
ncbi:YqaJ viral recombinase family protein [Actinoallomurus acanthiterrae]